MNEKEQEKLMEGLVRESDEHAVKLATFLNSGVPTTAWEAHPDALVEACAHISYAMTNLGVVLQTVAPNNGVAVQNIMGTVTNCMFASLSMGRKVAGYVPEEKSRLIVPDSNIRMN